jgi:hypothetical protein
MGLLVIVFPFLRRFKRLPFSRDQAMLAMAALNELLLGVEAYLAHSMTGTIHPKEWIPILFGPLAAILLLAAGVIALRKRMAANLLGSLVYLASFIVGVLGAFYHMARLVLPAFPNNGLVSIELVVWAPPLLAPLAFALIGLLGISAIWQEDPAGSGNLKLPAGLTLRMPYSKTQAYFLMVCIGLLIALVSSTLDHARTGFHNPWLLVPLGAGVFGAIVAAVLGFEDKPARNDLTTYVFTMVLMAIVGMLGSLLHVLSDLEGSGTFVLERFLRGAPFMAPMLFANFGAVGLLALLDPEEKKKQ